MCAALSVQTVLLSRESQGTAFQATATAAGAVLRSTFANHLRQLDAAARAIEAIPPARNETLLRNTVMAALAASMTDQGSASFLALGFARAVLPEDTAVWESAASRDHDTPAHVRSGSVNASGGFSLPLGFANNEPAFVMETLVPHAFFNPSAGQDLASISPERAGALRRAGSTNRVTLTGQVLSLNARFPIAFYYVPVFVELSTLNGSDGRASLARVPTSAGPRFVPDYTPSPRGVVPHPTDRVLGGVLTAAVSASGLIDHWKLVAGGIRNVEVLLKDVTGKAEQCVDVSGHSGAGGNITDPAPTDCMVTCRNGTAARPCDAASAGAWSPDISRFHPATEADGDLTCVSPEDVVFATADGATVVDIPTNILATDGPVPASEVARSQISQLCNQIAGSVASRAGSNLRSRSLIEVAGRRWQLHVVADANFEAANGAVSVPIVALVSALASLVAGGMALLATSSIAAAARSDEAQRRNAAERLRVAQNVHHTTVSYLAHEIRGGLSVSSIGAGLAAEGLREDGLMLSGGAVVTPEELFGRAAAEGGPEAAALLAAASCADDDVLGAVSSAGLLRDLQRIQAASASSLRLIEDVLDIVGLETGRLAVNLGVMVPARFLRAIADRYRAMSAVPIVTVVDDDVPSRVLTDPLRCEQAILNGLSNAMKHTRTGSIRVRLSVVHRLLPASWVRVRQAGMNFFEQAAASTSAEGWEDPALAPATAAGSGRRPSEEQAEGLRGCCSGAGRWGCGCLGRGARRRTSHTPAPEQGEAGWGAASPGCGESGSFDGGAVRTDASASDAGHIGPAERSWEVASTVAPAGHPTVSGLRAPFLRLRVTDNGGGLGGIDPEELLRPFVTDNKRISRGGTRVRSTGLGLPIAAQVAELVGGRVTLEDDGEGHAVYSLYVPLVPPRRIVDAAAEGSDVRTEGEALLALLMAQRGAGGTMVGAQGGRAEGAYQRLSEALGVTPGRKASATSAPGASRGTAASGAGEPGGVPVVETTSVTAGIRSAASMATMTSHASAALSVAEDVGPGLVVTGDHSSSRAGSVVVGTASSRPRAGRPQRNQLQPPPTGPPLIMTDPTPSDAGRGGGGAASVGPEEGRRESLAAVGMTSPAPPAGRPLGGILAAGTGQRISTREGRDARRRSRRAERQAAAAAAGGPAAAAEPGDAAAAPGTPRPEGGNDDASAAGPRGSIPGAASSGPGTPGSGPPHFGAGGSPARAASLTRGPSTGSRAGVLVPAVHPSVTALPGRAGAPLSGCLVLVVDDEPMVLASTTRLLRRLGCGVVPMQNPLQVTTPLVFAGQAEAGRADGGSGMSSGDCRTPPSLPRGRLDLPKGWVAVDGVTHCPPHQVTPVSALSADEVAAGGRGRFSAVFLDIVMPQRNGDEVAASLRRHGYTGPLIAATGNVTATDVARYSRSGFNAVIGKPLDRDSVLSAFRALSIHTA